MCTIVYSSSIPSNLVCRCEFCYREVFINETISALSCSYQWPWLYLCVCVCVCFTTAVDFEVVNVTNETFTSDWCTSPSVNSLSPYFTLNGDILNGVTFNGRYQVNISRHVSSEGHHQAMLSILAVNSTLDNSMITCWVNSTVIFRYLITCLGKYSTLILE